MRRFMSIRMIWQLWPTTTKANNALEATPVSKASLLRARCGAAQLNR